MNVKRYKLKYGIGFMFILVTFAFLLSGCGQQVTCNKPYILVGNDCCLDTNDNAICDSDEEEKDSPAPECGDGACNGDEGCLTCSQDCGKCPEGNYCNSDENCESDKCRNNACVTCTDECTDWGIECYEDEGPAGYFYCADENNDGCKELVLFDYCGLDYTCADRNTCVSPSQEAIFQARAKGSIITQFDNDLSQIVKGKSYTSYERGEEVTCTILSVKGDFLTASCK